MNCRHCQHPIPAGQQFCSECGARQPEVGEGISLRGVAIDASGGTIHIGSSMPAPAPGSIPLGGHCAICGRFNPAEKTFRCIHCGRDRLCQQHQHPTTFWCLECSGQPAAAGPLSMFQVNYQLVHPNLPRQTSSLAQALITFSCGDDSVGSDPTTFRTHLCLLLDVSGSMNAPDKYPLLRQAVPQLIEALSDGDYLTIILFSLGCDVVLRAESLAQLHGKHAAAGLLARLDQSGVMFGRRTNLASGLRAAIEQVEAFRRREPDVVDRMYILTDGELHDAEECAGINPRLRSLECELHSYGFGKDFALDTMKRIMEGVPGGTVKPIFNTHDVKTIFGHVGALGSHIVAQDAEFSFAFADKVIAGDAFRYRPGHKYYGQVDLGSKTFCIKLGNLESGREYAYFLEGQVRPADREREEIGRAVLRYRTAKGMEQSETAVVVGRCEDPLATTWKDESAFRAISILDALRKNDPGIQLNALRARRELYRLEGADPQLLELVELAIAKMEKGEDISDDMERGLNADACSVFSLKEDEWMQRIAASWLRQGYATERIRWALNLAERLKNTGESLLILLERLPQAQAQVLKALLTGASSETIAPELAADFDASITRSPGILL
jgi:hypothetical protein